MIENSQKEKNRKYIVLGMVLIVLVAILFLLPMIFTGTAEPGRTAGPPVRVVDERKLSEESFNKTVGDRITDLEQTVKNLQKEISNEKVSRSSGGPRFALKSPEPEDAAAGPLPALDQLAPRPPVTGAPMVPPPSPARTAGIQAPNKPSKRLLTGLIASERPKFEEKKTDDKKPEKPASVGVPAWSFTKALLISGVDAPTKQNAKGDPRPALLKLTGKTVLPNRGSADLRECFVGGLARADLSGERVYFQTKVLSCLTPSGKRIEKEVDGYVAGEDGKDGLLGRVYSKQGALLARTLVAGFLDGLAGIYEQQATIVSIQPTGTVSTIDSGKALQAGLFAGSASAAEKLADFYMKLVNDTFPVIEVAAGREVDVVFISGLDFEQEVLQ
jgi:conjugal transfer pilus assembly protein TraB